MVPDEGFMVPQKKLYDAFVQEKGVDGYRLNQTMKAPVTKIYQLKVCRTQVD